MAVDSANKRFSMLNFGSGMVTSDLLFEADGTVEIDDRPSLLGLYGGVASLTGGVNTADKRLCMLNWPYTESVQLLPSPDGEIDADDRLHLLDLYCGLPSGGLDTAAKRLCMLNFPYTESVQLPPLPDGDIDAPDRLQLLDLYCGLVEGDEDEAGSSDAVRQIFIDHQGQDIDEQEALLLILMELN